MEIEHAVSVSNHLGEGPIWHQTEQRLYWVDATNNSYLTLEPSTGKVERNDVGRFTISVAFCDNGKLLVATDTELTYWDPRSRTSELIATGSFDAGAVRFNDGKVDPAGGTSSARCTALRICPLAGSID